MIVAQKLKEMNYFDGIKINTSDKHFPFIFKLVLQYKKNVTYFFFCFF